MGARAVQRSTPRSWHSRTRASPCATCAARAPRVRVLGLWMCHTYTYLSVVVLAATNVVLGLFQQRRPGQCLFVCCSKTPHIACAPTSPQSHSHSHTCSLLQSHTCSHTFSRALSHPTHAGYLEGTPLLDLNYAEDAGGGPDVSAALHPHSGALVLLQMDNRCGGDFGWDVLSEIGFSVDTISTLW